MLVPLVVMVLALSFSFWANVSHVVAAVGHAPAKERSTILAVSLAEALTAATLGLVELPVMLVAWFVDRKLRPAPKASPQSAASGSRCATHAQTTGAFVCHRCGSFRCGVRRRPDPVPAMHRDAFATPP